MRSNKILFLVFLVLYFIAGLALIITGGIAHHQASYYTEISGNSIKSAAGFVIALGVIILILSLLGFFGAYSNRLTLLQIFIGTLLLIILLQLIAAIVGFSLRHKADEKLRTKLLQSLGKYENGNGDVGAEWDRLQQSWTCCGVDRWEDWPNSTTRTAPPDSCCRTKPCPAPQEKSNSYFSRGCYIQLRGSFIKYSRELGGVSLFFWFVEIVGLILGIVLLRDLKNNYGSV